MHILTVLFLGSWLAGFPGRCIAGIVSSKDLNPGFFWGFNGNSSPTSFPSCSSVSISISLRPNSTIGLGIPPFSMYSFEPGGIPHVQRIGSNPLSLSWTVDHLPGTKLLLVMLDSLNNTGGIPEKMYDVVSGSTACISQTSDPPSTFKLSSNVTDQLTTCEPWGLTATNGTPPYTIYITAVGSDTITVVKMGDADNTLIYPDRVEPNTSVFASIQDSLGIWGNSTQAVTTTGSSDPTCSGQESVSTFQTPPNQPNNNNQPNNDGGKSTDGPKHSRSTVAIGVVVGVTVPLLIILGLVYWRRHRRQAQKNQPRVGIWDDDDTGAHAQDALIGATGVGELGEMQQHTSPSHSYNISSSEYPTPYPTHTNRHADSSTTPLLRQTYFIANPDNYRSSILSSSAGNTSLSSDSSNATSSRVPLTALSPALKEGYRSRWRESTWGNSSQRVRVVR
ncbi:hypothetical protein QCA50_018004 [Cerrena zonata]|uniref:Mid2 domain-containing protein n=1 Tax=Cerrena zonata TaxID=2478898 RepID=A0AAW0FQQ3_9APHY